MKDKFGTIVADETPVLIDFHATWCGPCQTLAPILEEVKTHFGEALKIIKIDVDKNRALAQRFKVRSVPTLVLFKEGNPVWRQAGLVSKRDMVETINSYRRKN